MSTGTEDSKGTILSGFADEADKTDDATPVNDYIFISKDMGDSILITTPGGDVVINTGLPGAGPKHSSLLLIGRKGVFDSDALLEQLNGLLPAQGVKA